MGEFEDRAREAAHKLVASAVSCGATVATAESCTAGLVASTIASVPGASDVLRGGAITYVDEIKNRLLGVSSETLERYTAVSSPCACEMAEGARSLFEVSAAVSVTGYAGPAGGTAEDPVGTVYFGISTASGTETYRKVFAGSRDEVRWQAAAFALELLCGACDGLM